MAIASSTMVNPDHATPTDVVGRSVDVVLTSIRENNRTNAASAVGQNPNSFESLKLKLSELELAGKVLGGTIASQIAFVQRQLNQHAPVNRLPVELLALILRTLSELSETPYLQYSDLFTYRSVSVIWRDIIDGCPYLWTVVNRRGDPELILMAIRKSRNLPLIIHHYRWGRHHQSDAVLERELHRWKTAKIIFKSPKASINLAGWPVLQHSAPLLERLTVCLEHFEPSLEDSNAGGHHHWPISLLNDRAPNLRYLRQNKFPILWGSSVFKGLRSWRLTNVDYVCSVEELLRVLAECNMLEELHLDSAPLYRSDREVNQLPVVHLRHIRKISLFDDDAAMPEGWVFLVNQLQVPDKAEISLLAMQNEGWDSMLLDPNGATLGCTVTRLLSSSTNLIIAVDCEDEDRLLSTMKLFSNEEGCRFTLHFLTAAENLLDTVTWVVQAFGLNADQPATCAVHFRTGGRVHIGVPDFLYMMDTLPNLRLVSLETKSSHTIRYLLRSLAKPIGDPPPIRWSTPVLESLIIKSECDMAPQDVIRPLRARIGLAPPDEDEDDEYDYSPEYSLPPPLKRFEYRNLMWNRHPAETAELKGVLGDGVARLGVDEEGNGGDSSDEDPSDEIDLDLWSDSGISESDEEEEE